MVRISPSWLLAGPTVQPTSGLGHAEFRILRHWMVRDLTIDYSWTPLLFVSNQIKEVSRISFPWTNSGTDPNFSQQSLQNHHHQPLLSVAKWLKKKNLQLPRTEDWAGQTSADRFRWRHHVTFSESSLVIGRRSAVSFLAKKWGNNVDTMQSPAIYMYIYIYIRYPFFLKDNHQRGLTTKNRFDDPLQTS